ncbi:MAG: OmpA family protein [Mucilaginibacter sp.]
MKKLLAILIITAGLMLPGIVKAQQVLKQADEEYNLFNYSKAVELYLKAYKKDSTLYIAQRIANSYRLVQNYAQTEAWYAKVVKMEDSPAENVLRYAEALQNNSKYPGAKAQYIRYYTLSKDVNKAKLKVWTTSCDSAVRWMKDPKPIEIENERTLNSPKSDWGATNYNNTVVFTSDRGNKKAEEVVKKKKPLLYFGNDPIDKETYGWTANNYLKLYRFNKNGTADTVELFPLVDETEYHTGAATFTADGAEMYFTITRLPKKSTEDTSKIKTIKPEIWHSSKNASTNKWGKPVAFRYNAPDKWSAGDPFITPGGDTLYFVSDMPGGQGGTDIYSCVREPTGDWAKPVNLKALNTSGDERTPFLDSEGNIYFSTDGGIGMGGLDIFKAARKGDTYAPKQNMGYPLNSPRDDFAYVVNDDTTGYLSSNRAGGQGSDDIYSYVKKASINFTLEGVVYEKGSHTRLSNSMVTLTKGSPLKVTADANGKYRFSLKENSDYALRGEKGGYLSDNQIVSTKGLTASQVIKKDLYLEKIQLNKAIRIENIYYDFDQWNIRPDAALELDKLIKILKDNPDIYIELSSHTDSKGDDDYNHRLSQKRANAAVTYIIETGEVDEERIIARGYGESRLLNRCKNGVNCSSEEHQLNRRTEFRIIKM